jgi:hypothetical protein
MVPWTTTTSAVVHQSTMDRGHKAAVQITRVTRAGDFGRYDSLQWFLERERESDARNLTAGKRQRCGDGARPTMSSKGGGGSMIDGEVLRT